MRRIVSLLNGIRYIITSKMRVLSFNISPSAKIGKDVVIKRGSVICDHSEIGYHSELYRHVVINHDVIIGDYTSINCGTRIDSGIIGNFCSIGMDCIIGPGEHPLNFLSTSTLLLKTMLRNGLLKDWGGYKVKESPRVGNDVWIGSRAIVMRGVVISDGAVIASNAVVTKDVPPYAIVGGVPAEIVKYRFNEVVRQKLLEIDIWNHYQDHQDYIKEMTARGENLEDYLYEREC